MESKVQDFKEFIEKNIVIFDGAMGTRLYEKGVFINRVYDELNLSQPALIKEVHQEYIDAGAMVIETNSFGANRFKLAPHGLDGKVRDINLKSVEIAREAAGNNVWVAGSIGPLGVKLAPLGTVSEEEGAAVFGEQAQALLDGGVDLLILETFFDLNEIHCALKTIRRLTDKPIIASMAIDDDEENITKNVEKIVKNLELWGADIIGLNCSVGPQIMFEAMEKMRSMTNKPLIAQPNAGLPKMVGGRSIYLCNPEYFGEYARRFIQLGVHIVGGCCGTTPEHIKWVANTVKSLTPGGKKAVYEIIQKSENEEINAVKVIPLEERSALGKKLALGQFVVTAELTAPKGFDPTKVLKSAQELKEIGVDAVNIPDGPRASARLCSLATASLINEKVGIEVNLHFCGRDRNIIGLQSDMLGAYALGLRNVLCITGDPPKVGNYPQATAVFDVDSIGLVQMIQRLNRGYDLANNSIGKPTAFVCGVGLNPGAIDMELEISRFEQKVRAGAEFAVTQPVFDIELLQKCMERVKCFGIPVFAGIWPLASLKNAEFMNNEVPGASVPNHIMERLRKAGSIEAEREIGIAVAREMLAEVKNIVNGVQLSVPFGKTENIRKIVDVIGL